MATNLAIDDKLIEEARIVGKFRTKKETVTRALEEFIRSHKQTEILDIFGKLDYEPDYDYKRQRNMQ